MTINDKTGTGYIQVLAGNGGNGLAGGGVGGAINGVKLAAPLADVRIGDDTAGTGGNSTGTLVGTGGAGGEIKTITGTAGYLRVISGSGGNGSAATSGGIGGDGGAISAVTTTVTHYLQQIRTGNGGNGSAATAGNGGDGGAISSVTVTGAIGNFAQTFGTAFTDMGGVITGLAGAGGTNGATGSVNGVKATKIAAMFAGDSSTAANALTTANAITAVANVIATEIGADVAGNGFSFTDNGGAITFDLGTDDAIDGLVLALNNGYDFATVSETVLTDARILA